MKNINNKEFSFISEIDNRKLTNVLYNGELVLDFQEEVKKQMFQLFSDKYIYQIIKDSDILYSCEDSSYIGKYKEYFWYTNEDGYISFIDTNFSNFLYFMTDEHTFSIIDKDLYEDFEDTLSRRKINLNDYILKYKLLCEKNGYSFDMKWEYDENKAEEFDRIIEKLK